MAVEWNGKSPVLTFLHGGCRQVSPLLTRKLRWLLSVEHYVKRTVPSMKNWRLMLNLHPFEVNLGDSI